ncbi:GH92 family glycosyl hydrolase [Desertivirga xinjiangensis]|uniref:GH92 family glycosyl hydrolase n=1 Tax=Desertivirga xinjiangensis TaxID=539206 RepID=UPI002109F720|nr:GH92 family glycosyl hydrolase [Pedobacter xinjiangensis]
MCIRKITLLLLSGVALTQIRTTAQENSYPHKVNTRIGTEGKGASAHEAYLEAGYTFPGAMYPFGMAQFTPTFFHPNKGFVINQMSGAGCEHMGNLPLLPLPGELKSSPEDMLGYKPEFKIRNAYAGFYEVLDRGGVNSALTVTTRTGMGKFDFPANNSAASIIIGTGLNATTMKEANVNITSNRSFEGFADGGAFCGTPVSYRIYFAAEFDTEAAGFGTWQGEKLKRGNRQETQPGTGIYFTFKTAGGKSVLYKVGISYVSLANAKENLKTENPGWDFNKIKNSAIAAWNKQLSKIEVKGGSRDRTTQFYTHLYRALAHPNVFNDVNGEYIGGDNKVHQARGFNYYTAFSNWDTYRTQTQLISMLAPKETSDMMKSILLFAEQSGGGFPRWVLNSTETGIMQGDPTAAMVSVAHSFGANDFDTRKALQIMKKGAEDPSARSQDQLTRPFLKQYLEKGYMNASMMLEYTTADFAIAQFAKQALADDVTYKQYLKRAQNWKNLYHPETKWLNSRNENGTWKKHDEDWREASYKNYFWMVPYNLGKLIDTIGGKDVAEKRLDEFFVRLDASYSQEWFAAGNEPDFQAPWIYNWTNAPYKTQALVKRIIREQYRNKNNGLPGNDDLGAMGAWYVFANIGLYPVIPGVAGFSVNSPSFSSVKVHLKNGTIDILGGDEKLEYIESLKLNGKPLNSTWIEWEHLKNGARLNFKLSNQISKTWGTKISPPSYN